MIKRGLLIFWAVWTGLVFASNATDALKELRVLPESWAFASRNFNLMMRTTAIYRFPEWIVGVMFGGVIGWEAAGTWAFSRAAMKPSADGWILSAFGVNLALWAAFMIADEVFLAYPMENVHRAVFIAQLLTLIGVWIVPER